MTVVVITGVLATIGFAAIRGRVSAARGAEALNMVQSIRAAEERWRAENMMYLNVSVSDTWYPVDPGEASHDTERAFHYAPGDTTHPDNERWLLLRPTVSGAVRFGYRVNAGTSATAMTTPARGSFSWPTPTDNWYVIQATGDTDWDETLSYYLASSLDGEVLTIDHGD